MPKIHCSILMVFLGLTGCASYTSVSTFGGATHSFGKGIGTMALGSYKLCQEKAALDWELGVVTGTAKLGTDEAAGALPKDACTRYHATALLYSRLGLQVGAFGLALKTLADSADTDYSEDLSATASGLAGSIPALAGKDEQLAAATKLANKTLQWLTQGYSASHLTAVIEDSDADFTATLELLGVLLDAYDEQAKQYEQSITKVATAPDFKAHNPSLVEIQAKLIQRHVQILESRRAVLAANRKALAAIEGMHKKLVAEAKRRKEEYDLAELVQQALVVAAEVQDFRATIAAIGG